MNWFFKKTDLKKIKPYLPIAIVALSAFLIRLIVSTKIGDFFWDEIFSFTFSQKSWSDSLELWLLETNPPLHMLFLKIWFYFFPTTELFSRLPSILFGTGSVVMVYLLGKKILNKKTGLISAIILTLLPYHIFLSVYARAYSLLIFLTTLSAFLFFKTSKELSKKNFLSLSTVNLLLLFTHLTGIWIVITEFILLIKKPEALKKFFVYHLPVGLFWGGWVLTGMFNKLSDPTNLGTAWFFNFEKNLLGIFVPLKLIFFGPSVAILSYLAIILFSILTLIFFKNKNISPEIKKITFPIMLFFILPIIAILFFKLWNIKFITTIIPFFVVIIAIFITQIFPQKPLLFLIPIIFCLPGLNRLILETPINNWGKLNELMNNWYEPQKQELIVASNFNNKLLFERYLNTNLPIKYCLKQKINSEDFVRENYLNYQRDEEQIRDWYKTNNIENYNKIFLFEDNNYGVNFKKILEENGWQQKQKTDLIPADLNTLFIYEKN